MLKQTQSQRLSQKILPQLIQRQSLLAIPTLSIEQMIRQEIEINPFLEEDEELVEEQIEESDEIIKTDEESSEDLKETEKADEEFDLDDFVDSEIEGYKTETDPNKKEINYDNLWRAPTSLKDNLITQLHLSEITSKQIFIGEEIIGNLDDEGYLREDLNNILDDLNIKKLDSDFSNVTFTIDEINQVINIIQTFDPPGICARNLIECLSLQISRLEINIELKNLCLRILNEYFEEFRLKNYEKLMKELNVDINSINEIFELFSKLDPKPGYTLDDNNHHYIIPDVIVTKEDDNYRIELNDRGIPRLKINNTYKKLIKKEKNKINKDSKDFIKENYERAKWFIEAIESRKNTILKVMTSILERQKDFFDNMGYGLKPLYEKEVAQDIGMDISTVSRTVRGKYVQTDFGIFELKYFFSNTIKTEEGEDISSKEIKEKLKEIINNENHLKPFTDDELTNELNKIGYKISRRTVAKYRESLNIPKARLRRKL